MFRLAKFARIRFRKPAPAAAASEATPDAMPETTSDAAPDARPLEEQLIAALRTVNDPEIPINIYDLGLIYDLSMPAEGQVDVKMTLTAPACPVAGMMPGMVEAALRQVKGIDEVRVELVWDPPWSMERISDEARLQLGLM